MSAEEEARQHLTEIFTLIKETLEEAKEQRKDIRQLSNDEQRALNEILNKLKQVRSNLNNYLTSFRVQTSLTQFDQNITE